MGRTARFYKIEQLLISRGVVPVIKRARLELLARFHLWQLCGSKSQ